MIPGCDLLVGLDVMDYCFVLLNLFICVCALFDSIPVFLTPSTSTKRMNPKILLYKNHALFSDVSPLCLLLCSFVGCGNEAINGRVTETGEVTLWKEHLPSTLIKCMQIPNLTRRKDTISQCAVEKTSKTNSGFDDWPISKLEPGTYWDSKLSNPPKPRHWIIWWRSSYTEDGSQFLDLL